MPLRSKPAVVELFAGAGLFSHAFAEEGFTILRAVELDRVAAASYALNLGKHVEVADVRTVPPSGRCDVLIAGPPCQGFSTLGKMDELDPRNQLSHYVVNWVRALRPWVVVIENVAAFVKSPVYQHVLRRLASLGYSIQSQVLNALDFGVAQVRHRSLTIASRGAGVTIERIGRRWPRTVREAWRGLSSKPDGHRQHYAPSPSKLAWSRMRVIPPGGDKRDVMRRAPHLVPPSWRRLGPSYVTDVWGRMAWDEPSNTLRTALLNPSKGRYIHPSQNRVISLREAARLQGIPDWWDFEGAPYSVARQIGNSVPVPLGLAVARGVRKALG
jgi:DNA (cytosine-5)-methyltransferase 1